MTKRVKNIIINCSNLQGGGGLQVGIAFLTDLLDNNDLREELTSFGNISLLMSSAMHKSMIGYMDKLNDIFNAVVIINTNGLKGILQSFKISKYKPDIIFTVFGPNYALNKCIKITGFAQPWIIYPSTDAYSKIKSIFLKIRTHIKFELQWLFFKKDDHLIVELPHVKNALINTRGFMSDEISIAENSINPNIKKTYNANSKNKDIYKSKIDFGIVSRLYPHKNIDYSIKVTQNLIEKHNINAMLHLTLNEHEANILNIDKYNFIKNHGVIEISDIPRFYSSIDYVIFPSLLECFSATPLEALFFGKVIFCSNKSFIRDCIQDNAIYFDPMDVNDGVIKINNFLKENNKLDIDRRIKAGKKFLIDLPTSKDRSKKYLKIIKRKL